MSQASLAKTKRSRIGRMQHGKQIGWMRSARDIQASEAHGETFVVVSLNDDNEPQFTVTRVL